MEKAGGGVAREKQAHGHAAGRDAEDGHLVGVATEGRDVVSHPNQCQHHVHESKVGFGAVERRMGEETERAEPVVERGDHDALLGEKLAGDGARSSAEPAAVQPHHHRACGIVGRGSPDVDG